MKKKYKFLLIVFLLIVIGLLLPQKFVIPVKGADKSSYNPKTFWYYPWGKSGTHKGADFFAKEGTPVVSSVSGIVLHTGANERGGNVIMILGPKFRIHYYAHLKDIKTKALKRVGRGETIATVGSTGNAQGKPPHLHYSITTLVPYVWRIDDAPQGWKKMFYLNPLDYLSNN